MFEKEAEIKLSEEEYKLAEEVIYPLFHKMRQNGDSLAKYGVECYLAGLNKANEWHYPSKGEYPKDEKNVLCTLGKIEDSNTEVGYYRQYEGEKERWHFSAYSLSDDSEDYWGVSAWKEIVLPELPKESK